MKCCRDRFSNEYAKNQVNDMDDVMKFIDSGILEMYVSGNAAPEQIEEVVQMAKKHEKVRAELYSLELAL